VKKWGLEVWRTTSRTKIIKDVGLRFKGPTSMNKMKWTKKGLGTNE
jgi:hypothetical protein